MLESLMPYYDWVGFYLVDAANPGELVLGPFVGEPTEHVRIPFGKGICGQAAESGETFIVQDISEQSNYLACNLKVKAEIVVPLIKDGKVIGELDIDSHKAGPFTDGDREFLEEIAGEVVNQSSFTKACCITKMQLAGLDRVQRT
jgi:GAF domain-containing protein